MGTQTTLVWLSRDGGRMTSQSLTLHEPTLLQRSAACPRRSTFETAAGSLILHSFCPPSLVTSLKADRRLHAFTHVPEREHQLLLGLQSAPIVRSRWRTLLPARLKALSRVMRW